MTLEDNVSGIPAETCPCGKRGRFNLYIGNGMKLCLDHMQYWLSQQLKVLRFDAKPEDKK